VASSHVNQTTKYHMINNHTIKLMKQISSWEEALVQTRAEAGLPPQEESVREAVCSYLMQSLRAMPDSFINDVVNEPDLTRALETIFNQE